MALIKCEECGNEVSSKAVSCPKCGARVGFMKAAWNAEVFGQIGWGGIGKFFGAIFGVLAAITLFGQFLVYQERNREVPLATSEGAYSTRSSDPVEPESSPDVDPPSPTAQMIEVADLRGEWVGDMFGAMADPNKSMAQHHRILVLHGTLKNVSSDPLSRLTCPAKLTVHFTNGRSAEASVDDVCGDTELLRANAAMGGGDMSSLANLTIDAGREYSFGLDKSVATLLAKVGNGLALHGKYHSYPVDKVILIVDFAGKTAFGDTVNGRLVETEIPVPSETSAFAIVG